MEFHKIHCTKCGEKVSADQLAVNLDRIICDHLKNQVERLGESSLRELSELVPTDESRNIFVEI